MTKQRATILDIIRTDRAHHTADEIFHIANERLGKISLATVYNNLHALEEAGLIRRLTAEHLADRYDSSFIPHGHLICEQCEKVTDFNIDGFEELLNDAIGNSFSSYELKVRHLCHRCKEKENA